MVVAVRGGDGGREGLLGSRYFAAHLTVALSSLAAAINMDMFPFRSTRCNC